jgi:CheY-like chemotaxis protein
MNILIADDNATNRKLLRAQLEAEGVTVVEAADGMEALAALGRETVDAIISDILMPRMDGYRLCYELRRDDRWKKLPFIIYTASYTSPSDEKLSLDMGADKHLRKPATTRALLAALRDAETAPRRPAPALKESDVLKEYRKQLVSKLEEKNAELRTQVETLRASEARLRDIFDNEPECVKLLAADGSLLDMNPAGLRMLEADSFQQVEVHGVYPLVVEEHRAALKALTEKVFAGESGIEFQIVGLRGGRRGRPAEDRLTP